jgi:hypothetical protein
MKNGKASFMKSINHDIIKKGKREELEGMKADAPVEGFATAKEEIERWVRNSINLQSGKSKKGYAYHAGT